MAHESQTIQKGTSERQRKTKATLRHHFDLRKRVQVEVKYTQYISPPRTQTILTAAPPRLVPPDSQPKPPTTTYISPIRKQMTLTGAPLKTAHTDD